MIENASLKLAVENLLKKKVTLIMKNFEWNKLGGGSINSSYIIRSSHGTFFTKCNNNNTYPELFETEKKNLDLLATTKTLAIPQVIGVAKGDDQSCLVLEYIETGAPHYDFWQEFGHGLAQLHQHTNSHFGLDYDNYIGSLKQSNNQHADWATFFIKERLEPMLQMAFDSGKADEVIVKKFHSLFNQIEDIFPKEKPSLLHGDLWSGNFMSNMDGSPVIFDPATYYGHREMDIAMSSLFGGFDPEFYETYNESFPLEKGWQQRLSICNLYPLLVHVNLFVGSYIQSVRNIVNSF